MLYSSQLLTKLNMFTSGIEGPACDAQGNLYAVNYGRQQTIGKVTSDGQGSEFLLLPDNGIGNGIRFDRAGSMFIADYVNHRILKVNMESRDISVYAEEPAMNQPNDLAITSTGIIFASDPNWEQKTGQLWRIDLNGKAALLENAMGTTNGIEVSFDEMTLYVNESVQRKIWQYDLSDSYEISNKRLLIEFSDYGFDGMRCDIRGNLFVTRHGKGTVVVISPLGKIIKEISLEGKNCTNLTFGGRDGRTCYVTVADTGSIEAFRTKDSGRCWAMLTGD